VIEHGAIAPHGLNQAGIERAKHPTWRIHLALGENTIGRKATIHRAKNTGAAMIDIKRR
jgi:hypothetical protein